MPVGKGSNWSRWDHEIPVHINFTTTLAEIFLWIYEKTRSSTSCVSYTQEKEKYTNYFLQLYPLVPLSLFAIKSVLCFVQFSEFTEYNSSVFKL